MSCASGFGGWRSLEFGKGRALALRGTGGFCGHLSGSLLFSQAALGRCPSGLGSSVAFLSGPHAAFFPPGPATCPVSLFLTPSTLYLLDEDLVGSQAEALLPAASGEASERAPPLGPGLSLRVREQQPLSSLSSVLLYRTAPGDLRLVFYDEVCVCV